MDNGEAELIRPEDVQVLTTMDRVVSGSRRAIAEARAAGNEMTIAFAQAAGITQLQKAMTKEFMAVIMPLQGTSLGFVTDRDAAGGYPAETVRDCMISALMCGVGVAGNQFNIISGKMYITLAGVSCTAGLGFASRKIRRAYRESRRRVPVRSSKCPRRGR